MGTLAACSALTVRRPDRDRLGDCRPRRPNLPGQIEHPRPQIVGILDPVPRAVAADDEAMRRPNPQFFLDEQEIDAELRPVARP